MLTLVLPLVLVAMGTVLFRYLRQERDARALWRSSVAIGLTVGISRAVLASVGWYGVEHTGGPLQIPAYVLVMFALPEAASFGRQRGVAPLSFYFLLSALLIASSLVLVSAVAFAARLSRGQRDA